MGYWVDDQKDALRPVEPLRGFVYSGSTLVPLRSGMPPEAFAEVVWLERADWPVEYQ